MFAAVALVFAVIVVNDTIYHPVRSSVQATGAGWLLLAIVDVRMRLLSFLVLVPKCTASADSLGTIFHI